MEDWKAAESLEELREILELNPPEIDQENKPLSVQESKELSSGPNSKTTTSYSIKRNKNYFKIPFLLMGELE